METPNQKTGYSNNKDMQVSKDQQRLRKDLEFVQAGSEFEVITSKPRGKRSTRRYWLNRLQDRIYYSDKDDGDEQAPFIDIMEVDEIRKGWSTDEFNRTVQLLRHSEDQNSTEKGTEPLEKERCFSIHSSNGRQVSLQAPDEETAHRWFSVIFLLMDRAHVEARQNRYDPIFWLKRSYRHETGEEHDGLSFKQCKKLLQSMSIKSEPHLLRTCFQRANKNQTPVRGRQVLYEKEFLDFFQMVSHRPVIDRIYSELCGEEGELSTEILYKFLVNVQGLSTITIEEAQKLMDTYNAFSISGFRALLNSKRFDIRKEALRKVHQDMTRPLNEYWIRSSHNTYLLKDQLFGPSSIEGYIRAQDCACIELDLHDGPDGQAVITHGGTWTSTILARDVLEHAIIPYAFLKDDFPIILSFQDHLSYGQRQLLIADLEELLGPYLYRGDDFGSTSFPSPADLKRKIIISASKEKYGKLANICRVMPFKVKYPSPSVCSISESEADNILYGNKWLPNCFKSQVAIKERKEDLRLRTNNQIIRVYPSWEKQWSQNHEPLKYMNAGCHMVALNVQTRGRELTLWAGRFRANGDAAYVLKPESLINPKAAKVAAKKVTIRIISAQQLPKTEGIKSEYLAPFVKVSIEGVNGDNEKKKTDKVIGSGLNPVWDTADMTFTIRDPELAVILFKVKHSKGCLFKKNITLGSFALPVLCLAEGYRHVSLQDRKLSPLPLASLFVYVHVEDL